MAPARPCEQQGEPPACTNWSGVIQLAGSAQRTYLFPAVRARAFGYYCDLARTMQFLPHISIVEQYAPDQLRVLYTATESGLYRVRIYCDVRITIDQAHHRLQLGPLAGHPPVKNDLRLNAMTCQGQYASETVFLDAGSRTQIDYRLNLQASMPRPLTLRLIPPGLLAGAAHAIMDVRIAEITGSFIDQSIRAYARSSP